MILLLANFDRPEEVQLIFVIDRSADNSSDICLELVELHLHTCSGSRFVGPILYRLGVTHASIENIQLEPGRGICLISRPLI